MNVDRPLSIHTDFCLPKYILKKNISKNSEDYEILIRRNVRYIFDKCLNEISQNNIHIIINKLLNFYCNIIYLEQSHIERLIRCYYNKIKNVKRFSYNEYDYCRKKMIRYRINIKLLKKYGGYEKKKIERELEYIKSLKLVSFNKLNNNNEENLKLVII